MSDAADPPRDFERMLNPAPAEAGVDRSTLIRDFKPAPAQAGDEMEGRMREVETAQAALKDIAEAAARQEFPPRDVAAMVMFLCSEAGRNISGQSLSVCGGVETL